MKVFIGPKGALCFLTSAFILLPFCVHAQVAFSRINSLPVRNSPVATDMIPAERADGVTVRIPFDKFPGSAGTGDALTTEPLSQFAPTTSEQLGNVLTDETGHVTNAKFVMALGTLVVPLGKTFTSTNTLTLAGTDGSTLNIGTGGTLKTVAYTGAFSDLTGTTVVVQSNFPTTYTAGARQRFKESSTTPGFGFFGASADPSNAVEGDLWYRTDLHRVRYHNGTSVFSVASTADASGAFSEQTVADADVVWTNGVTTLRQTAALTANRTATLPAANSYNAGSVILFVDQVSSGTSAFGRAFSGGGGDSIVGGSPYTPFVGNGNIRFETNGSNTWTPLDTRQVVLALQDPTDPTKQAHFNLSGQPTATDREINIAADGDSTTIVPDTAGAGEAVTGVDADGNLIFGSPGGGSGTVTNFSAGDLSPLFTTSEATTTTTPALTFTPSSAGATTFFGNPSGTSAPPIFMSVAQLMTAAGADFALSVSAVRTGNYTAGNNELSPVDATSGSIVATLPNAPPNGTRVAVKLIALSGSNTVTVNCAGADVFNKASGSTSFVLSLLNQALELQYRSATGIWYVISNDAPLSESRKALVRTITSSATPDFSVDNTDAITITAQATDITSMTTGLTGTPSNFQMLIVRIKDNGTARGITWGASYAARGAALPTTTVVSKVLYVLFIYNSVTSTWDCVSTAQES